MRKVFRLLGIVLQAIFDITEEKPAKSQLGRYQAREQFDAGMISYSKFNEARKADFE